MKDKERDDKSEKETAIGDTEEDSKERVSVLACHAAGQPTMPAERLLTARKDKDEPEKDRVSVLASHNVERLAGSGKERFSVLPNNSAERVIPSVQRKNNADELVSIKSATRDTKRMDRDMPGERVPGAPTPIPPPSVDQTSVTGDTAIAGGMPAINGMIAEPSIVPLSQNGKAINT